MRPTVLIVDDHAGFRGFARAMLDAGFGELGLRLVRGETVSANDRIGALLRRLGFREAGGRAGPDWMRARGWSYALWELGAADWVAALVPTHSAKAAACGFRPGGRAGSAASW